MIDWQGAFIRIQYRKRYVKTLRRDFPAVFINAYLQRLVLLVNNRCQPCYSTFYNMLTDPSVQIGTRPFDFHIHHPIQYAVDFFNDNG
jgi:hypothetical protein